MTHKGKAVGQFALVCGLLALNMILPARAAEPALHGQYPAQRTLLSTATTVTGQPIRYPQGAAAHVTVSEITLAPGEETGWHRHPVPVFGYILAGELTVDYGPKGRHTYRTGDALVEAMNEAHNGRNTGAVPMNPGHRCGCRRHGDDGAGGAGARASAALGSVESSGFSNQLVRDSRLLLGRKPWASWIGLCSATGSGSRFRG